MARGVLLIDIQQDYFVGGAYPLVGAEAAAHVAQAVLADARSKGDWVGHVQHVAQPSADGFLVEGTPGAEIHSLVAPRTSEIVITKTRPNSYVGTKLQAVLDENDIDDLVVVGMMTSMCVDATVRAVLDSGRSATVIENGCAAPDLEFGGETVDGHLVHVAFTAGLRDAGATVVSWPRN
ncbi:MAG: isochorismatase family protein [Cryobacterium sp.]|uniref:isochorismatase family protein n=1 Tax=unclassified Cryobacterium TaxID=2649013 RepID=UPI0018C9553F|nr:MULTISPECIES: isochorismatase family protein [unclassified Cryobacterium]MCY7404068.1 isochorismatase family protein [Cryobacterium sp.]MEC5154306.1 nicotinamidase-related amidase [Cryobacterium sp. CAN_C3]